MASTTPTAGTAPPMAKAITTFVVPAISPLANVTCSGASSSRPAVTQLSSPQQTQAATMNTAPTANSGTSDQLTMTPPSTTTALPVHSRRPMCSRKNTAASTVVAANSTFSNSDAVAAGVRCRPAANNNGPSRPPAITAIASRRPLRLMPRRGSGTDNRRGATATAAPR